MFDFLNISIPDYLIDLGDGPLAVIGEGILYVIYLILWFATAPYMALVP
ncbi:MAG: hypothetical protein GY851_09055 [bacterium]|nr:hypothetical protein [bacterium]